MASTPFSSQNSNPYPPASRSEITRISSDRRFQASASASIRRRSSASRHRAGFRSGDPDGLDKLVPDIPQPAPDRSPKKLLWDKIGIHPFRGMMNDIRRRAPYYLSDWKDAWTYRVIPSTVDMFFKNLLPAIAFALDMFRETNNNFGINEVLLSSVLAAVMFSLFAGQPLCIVGVTGPITVFNYTVYDIINPHGIPYFPFLCWVGIWSMIMHFAIAILSGVIFLKFVTRFSCDVFGFYVCAIYIQKGIQVLVAQFEAGPASGYLAIAIALLVLIMGMSFQVVGRSRLFRHAVRIFLTDYGTILTIVFFTGFPHFGGELTRTQLLDLPTSPAFETTTGRGWLVNFWTLGVGNIFLAIPFAILLTILFYMDHNISSLMCQDSVFPLKKPASFHWDFFLLGLVTGISGLLGLPFPNGLIPQAPFHTASLCVVRSRSDPNEKHKQEIYIERVVEQRVTNLAQGLLILVTMSPPLLHVLGLIPQGVLAGLFFVMGLQGLEGNGMTLKCLWLLSDNSTIPENDPLKFCRKKSVYFFVGLELIGFGATFAVTQTIAAIGFPIIILLLVPVRMYICPLICTPEELFELDAPVASPFTMESVGASVVGVRATTSAESPEETSGETDERESSEDEDWRSAMERGDAVKLKRRTSSMIGTRTKGESSSLNIRGAVMTGESSRASL